MTDNINKFQAECPLPVTVVGGFNVDTTERTWPGSVDMNQKQLRPGETTHGIHKHKIYFIWGNIKQRCYNSNHPSYETYGARGIQMCDQWVDNPKAFYDYVIGLDNYDEARLGYDKDSISIDRKNNDGNYEPRNVRWTNRHNQSANQKKRKDNTSGFTGISYDKARNRWYVEISVKGKKVRLGRYIEIEEAVKVRENYIIEKNLIEYSLKN